MKEGLNSVREDARLANEKNECDCADEWREYERERSERGEYSSSGKCEAFEEKREWHTDERAEENSRD